MINTNKLNIINIYKFIKQSLSWEHQDYTQWSIQKAVFLLAIPMILELSLESVFAIVDIFFVSKLWANAIATVWLTEAAITILYSVAIGLSTAATAIVARRIGEKNPLWASHAGAQSFIIAMIITLIVSIWGIIFAGDILYLMWASNDVIRDWQIFTRIMFWGSIWIMLLFLINGVFRGAGDAVMAMRSLWVASIINIILCPIFIHFWWLMWAAIATVIGRSTGVIYQLYYLLMGSSTIKLHKSYFKLDKEIIKNIINIWWPATFQFIIASGSWIVLAKLVAETGWTSATAWYQIAIRCFIFFMLPAWWLSNAAATLVWQNLWAKQIDRAQQSVIIATKYGMIFMWIISFIFLVFANSIIKFFTPDPTVVYYWTSSLQILWVGLIFMWIWMIMTQALNWAWDTKVPTILNFICFWVFQVPLAFLLAKWFNLGVVWIFISIPFSQLLLAILAWFYFKKWNWKNINL